MASYMSVFKYLEIQLDDIISATNNFDNSKVIGRGGFGKVYKGEMTHPEGKIEVAFKRLDRKHGQGDPEFFKEIRMLSSYKHDNLISLLGYCSEGNEMILMYEYAAGGSLEGILNDAALTWMQRLKICIDVAKGLSILHDPNGTQQRVLHRDIKSANILLDENLKAKVADFGLSKISPANQPYTFLVTNPVGTHGYCDPLYMETYQLTKESDVYSFGVVLFEVLCGRVCYENSNGMLKVMVHFWKKCYEQHKLDEIIFPNLKQQVDESSLKAFVDIAYRCLQKTREQRPTMSIVVEKLKAALELEELHDLKLQREHEQEEMRKAAEYEREEMRKAAEYEREEMLKLATEYGYGEILKFSVRPLIYKSIEDLKALLSKGLPVNGYKTLYYNTSNTKAGAIVWFSLNENGEHCEMLSIAHCLISRGGGYELYRTNGYSRFHRSFKTNRLGFKVHIRTQFLTPSIRYTVNLVLCMDDSSKKQMHVALRYKLEGETEISILHLANETKDNSSYIAELYQFTSNGRTFDLDIVFEDHKDDLKVEGILFQPLEKVEYEQVLDDENMQWIIMKEGKKRTKLLKYFKEEHKLLDNGREAYAVDKDGKISLLLAARAAIKNWRQSFQSSPESRFGEVAVVASYKFKIEKEIKSDVVSPETTYATYLIYKLTQDQSQFNNVLKIFNFRGRDPDYPYIYLVSPPETPIIGQKLDQNSHNQPLIRHKGYAVPRQRKDGWMEVKVCEFQTPPSSTGTILMDLDLWTPDEVHIRGLNIESIELRPIVGHSV